MSRARSSGVGGQGTELTDSNAEGVYVAQGTTQMYPAIIL